jgi:hypothetical protein
MADMVHRRLFARVAAFAVAFGALWPLVSVAKPHAPEIPLFLCTQAGGPVQHPGAPASAGDEFHCPLCIATTDAVLPAIAASPVAALVDADASRDGGAAPPDQLFLARPPPSRAPPTLP